MLLAIYLLALLTSWTVGAGAYVISKSKRLPW